MARGDKELARSGGDWRSLARRGTLPAGLRPTAIVGVIAEVICLVARFSWIASEKSVLATGGTAIVTYRAVLGALTVLCVVIPVVCVMWAVVCVVRAARSDTRHALELEDPETTAALTTEDMDVLERVGVLREARGADEFLLSSCDEVVAQVKRISRRRAAFEEVRRRNKDVTLVQASDALEDADTSINVSAHAILDRLEMYVRYGDAASSSDQELMGRYRSKVESMLASNDRLIDESGQLIDQAMTYLENREAAEAESLVEVIGYVREAIGEVDRSW